MASFAEALCCESDDEGDKGRDPCENVVSNPKGLPPQQSSGCEDVLVVVKPIELDGVRLHFGHQQQQIECQHEPPEDAGQWKIDKRHSLDGTSRSSKEIRAITKIKERKIAGD